MEVILAENSSIEWTDIDPRATGRTLGAYKSAAKKIGCTLEEWITRRLAGLRHCFACRTWKAREEFTVDRQRPGGLTARCRECMSDASTAARYGMTVAQLLAFRQTHEHRCGICGATEIVYVDHDHATGKPRGLLCPTCNSAIGQLREDPRLFAAALAYLEKNRG
jgi:hypothetical protein